MDEIVAFAEQGFSQTVGGGIGKTIPVIESGAMTSLAEAAKSGTRELALLRIDGDPFDTGSGDESRQTNYRASCRCQTTGDLQFRGCYTVLHLTPRP